MGSNPLPPLVVMGVSGSGKSTLGALLGERLGLPFVDGDDLHPAANKEKMGSGIPLGDEDRRPWLEEIGRTLRKARGTGAVPIIACSALKRSYRDLLRLHVPDLVFIHLTGSPEVLLQRMNARRHEFMPASLLDSQLAALEPPAADERHIRADFQLPPESLLGQICTDLDALAVRSAAAR